MKGQDHRPSTSASYGAINFTGTTKAGPFHEQIRNGRKTQTIREPRKDGRPHVKVGYKTKLYWKMRTKKCFLIAEAEVIAYEEITLLDMWWDEENAKADGFQDLEEFRKWFFPDWFIASSIIRDSIQAAAELNRGVVKDMIVTFGRRFGKSSTMEIYEKMTEPLRRIKWKLL